mmetsp:Transcript_23861/g.18213  ORF Transcript_23861/g.18213 Transcript_23861/m.18213 type:complete len:89 (-) Transcript_23861:196-462(-)
MQEYLAQTEQMVRKNESKVVYLFRYIMNFRSRYLYQIRKLQKQGEVTANIEELHTHYNEISLSLKQSKLILDKYRIQTAMKPAPKPVQ